MSLLARILLLILVTTLTPAVVIGVYLIDQRDRQIDEAKHKLGALAKYATENLDDKAKGTVQLLHGLSRATDLNTSDKAACSAFLAGVLARYPQYTGLLTITPRGALHCDSLRSGRVLDLSERDYFKQVRASHEPAFDMVIGRITGIAVLQVAYPVLDGEGQLAYVLLASLNLSQYAKGLTAASPLANSRILIWNRKGILMARQPDTGGASFLGKDLQGSELFRLAASGSSRTGAELPGLDGVMVVWAFSSLPESGGGARIALGIPREDLLAEANRNLRNALALLIGVSLLAFTGAWYIAETGIRRHVRRIASVAGRVGGGDLTARIGAPYPRGELGELMAVIDRTAGSVQAQQTEIEIKSRAIERVNRTLRVLSGINTLIVRVRDRHELFTEACRIAVEHGNFGVAWIGMFDAATREVTPVAWAGTDAEHVAKSLSSVTAGTPHEEGVTGRAIVQQKPVYNNNITAEPERGSVRRQEVVRRGYRSAIALPLLAEGAAIGALTLYAKEQDFFNEEELSLLTELAGDISYAVENLARQQKLDKLSRVRAVSRDINAAIVRIPEHRALLEEVCRIIGEQGKFEMIWIGAIDQDKQQVEPVAWTGFSETTAHAVSWARIESSQGTLCEAFQTRKPSVRNDIDAEVAGGVLRQEAVDNGCYSTVTLPLIIDDRVTALIVLFARGRGFFDEDELALLEGVASDISFALQAIGKSERLTYIGYYDLVTGLANRTLFLERVAQYIRSAVTGGHKLALYLIDLERFRNINDSLGRPAGDALLQQVAEWLTRNVGDAGLLARVGADHFAVVMPKVTHEGGVARLMEKQMAAFLQYPFRLDGAVLRIAAKVGIAIFPDDGADVDTLFRNTEAALKKAKASGERYLFYTQKMTEMVAGKLTMENQLRQAIDNDEFTLHYQPKVNLASGKVTSAEALICWNDPRTGLVPPGKFIPCLEETGLIHEVGSWAMRQAIADYLRWSSAGLRAVRISVNVSALQLRNRRFIGEIQQAIGTDLNAAAGLELEITESLLVEDVPHSITSLRAIRAMGVTVAIDDFGTGFSSLSYLSKLPMDALKIDRSFIAEMTTGPQGLALVSTIVGLAHALKLRVVAEGVETDEQARLLRLLGCDEMQGFLFSKPLPCASFETKYLSTLKASVVPA